jgi:uncharacterized protein (TIGR02246 family)
MSDAKAQEGETPEARAVRAADEAWASAAASKNVDRMLACYAPDAVFISRTRGLCTGHDALREAWATLFARPGYALTWRATTVAVSRAGDLADSVGAWERQEEQAGHVQTMTGTYVAVWKKQADGRWKVAVDKP